MLFRAKLSSDKKLGEIFSTNFSFKILNKFMKRFEARDNPKACIFIFCQQTRFCVHVRLKLLLETTLVHWLFLIKQPIPCCTKIYQN